MRASMAHSTRSKAKGMLIVYLLLLVIAATAAEPTLDAVLRTNDDHMPVSWKWGVLSPGNLQITCVAFQVNDLRSASYFDWSSGKECLTTWITSRQRSYDYLVTDSCYAGVSYKVSMNGNQSHQTWIPEFPKHAPISSFRTFVAQCNERQELISLFQATNGPNWSNSAGWASWALKDYHYKGSDYCDKWAGIQCTNGRLSSLDLSEQHLIGDVGRIFASKVRLGDSFQYLTSLNLASNELTGTLPPDFGANAWPLLQNLHLGIVSLDDVPWNNKLGGQLGPDWGAAWTQLTTINLGMNTGFTSIAPQFGRSWSRVTRVYLTDCRYVGALPSSFGSAWSGLEFIDLSGNSFVIPPQFGASWTKLQMFWMRQNGKADPLPAVNSQSNIVPTAWNEFGQMWSSVESIDMSFSDVAGDLSPKFGSNWTSILSIFLSGNAITSVDSKIGVSWSKLQSFDVSQNQITMTSSAAFLPMATDMRWPSLYYLNYSHNRISGSLPVFRSFPVLQRFSVSDNLLSGTIPAEFGSNWKSLAELQLNQNAWSVDQLTGAFGLDSWVGKLSVCDINQVTIACPLPAWALHANCAEKTDARCQSVPLPYSAALDMRLQLSMQVSAALLDPVSRAELIANLTSELEAALRLVGEIHSDINVTISFSRVQIRDTRVHVVLTDARPASNPNWLSQRVLNSTRLLEQLAADPAMNATLPTVIIQYTHQVAFFYSLESSSVRGDPGVVPLVHCGYDQSVSTESQCLAAKPVPSVEPTPPIPSIEASLGAYTGLLVPIIAFMLVGAMFISSCVYLYRTCCTRPSRAAKPTDLAAPTEANPVKYEEVPHSPMGHEGAYEMVRMNIDSAFALDHDDEL